MAESGQDSLTARLTLSVVVPLRDEEANVEPLLAEIEAALSDREAAEYVLVDDGSRDGTLSALRGARERYPRLRILRHASACGQSRAVHSGVLHARGRMIAVLDGDGQNDPADIPALLALYDELEAKGEPIGMVAGERRRRHDSALRRISSRVANGANRRLLRHEARDIGCGLKVLSRATFLRLPYFDHMHRFMPPLIHREGLAVRYLPVNHRPRLRGRSNYGLWGRLAVGIIDLFGVRWLLKRGKTPEILVE